MARPQNDLFSDIESEMSEKTSRAKKSSESLGYTESHIEVLEGLEPVRRRPGMYIGGTDEKAMHHLFAEVIDNSMDEAVAGHASWIEVELAADGFLSVTDNGRGIPVGPHPKFKNKSALEVVMTILHAGGKFDSKAYNTSGGLHGVGVSVVNALSETLEVQVARDQQLYRMVFSRGEPQTKLEKLGSIMNRRGTKVRFKPDEKIFGKGCAFKPARLLKMARSKAYLFGGVEIRWKCAPELIKDDTPADAVFHFPGGLSDYLTETIEGQTKVTKDIFAGRVEKEKGHGSVEWATAWISDEDGFSSSYCNTIPTAEGGTHENGLAPGALQGLARLRRADQQQTSPADHIRRRDGHGGIHALRLHPRTGIPGPDQGQARDAGSDEDRRDRGARCLRSLARGQPAAGHAASGMVRRPVGRPPQAPPRKGSWPPVGDAQAAPARQARGLLHSAGGGHGNLHRRRRFSRRLCQERPQSRDAGDPVPCAARS